MTQRIAIIGGGVAGLAFAIYYKQLGGRVDIYERSGLSGREGLGFVMLENGMDAMQLLQLQEQVAKAGYPLEHCFIKNPCGDELLNESLPNSYGMARKAFVDTLLEQIPAEWIHFNHQFSHFEWDQQGNAKSAVFTNGNKIAADIFIGCDGGRSRVRKQIFPDAERSEIRVKELVSIVKCPEFIKSLDHSFVKYKSLDGGLAVGMVPADKESLIWFVQYDSHKYDIVNDSIEAKKAFAQALVGNWCSPIPQLIELTDYQKSHVWNTCYLKPLDRFYHKNVVLLGDAAHALLTFTSQGINSAVEDAVELATSIYRQDPIFCHQTITEFSTKRRSTVLQYLQQGIALQNEFLQAHCQHQKIPFAF